jgi:hypothetical protein
VHDSDDRNGAIGVRSIELAARRARAVAALQQTCDRVRRAELERQIAELDERLTIRLADRERRGVNGRTG